MRPYLFAWRSLTRQPARAALGVAGIAVVGALLFDMLLLSRGLAVSFKDLLDGVGFDIRVTASQWVPARGPAIADGSGVLARLAALDEVEEVAALRFGRAEFILPGRGDFSADFMGARGPARRTWTLLEGRDLPERDDPAQPVVLINRFLADRLQASAGDTIHLRGACDGTGSVFPAVAFTVAGVVEFQFEADRMPASVTRIETLNRICDLPDPEAVTLFLVASDPAVGPDVAVEAIRAELGGLHAFTNREFVDRLQVTDFSYFRQISFALSTITLFFAFMLIATLLTVSVNQRLGEVAALRALGFRRSRVVADLLFESALLVGAGALLALPLGGLMARYLDGILRQMPGIPLQLHFFVFQARAVAQFAGLMVATGVLAAAYPVFLAARLPIAATLRREVVG